MSSLRVVAPLSFLLALGACGGQDKAPPTEPGDTASTQQEASSTGPRYYRAQCKSYFDSYRFYLEPFDPNHPPEQLFHARIDRTGPLGEEVADVIKWDTPFEFGDARFTLGVNAWGGTDPTVGDRYHMTMMSLHAAPLRVEDQLAVAGGSLPVPTAARPSVMNLQSRVPDTVIKGVTYDTISSWCLHSPAQKPSWSCASSAYRGKQLWTCSQSGLYRCENGLPVRVHCDAGCAKRPLGVDDVCNPWTP